MTENTGNQGAPPTIPHFPHSRTHHPMPPKPPHSSHSAAPETIHGHTPIRSTETHLMPLLIHTSPTTWNTLTSPWFFWKILSLDVTSTRKLHDSFPSYPKAGISALLDVSNSITGMDPERVVTDHLLDWQHTEL